jgi:Tfp pilus assembly PilM family ATPase
VKLITRHSPLAIHFGSMDTRLLQLKQGPGGWSVSTAEVIPGSGKTRHTGAAEKLAPFVRSRRCRGKDCLLSTSGEELSVSLVPVDPQNRTRMQQTLKETALRSVQDAEGVAYRYMSLSEEGGQAEALANTREELLLLAVGQSELRRCTTALETLHLRPVGFEAAAFPLARTMQALAGEGEDPWAFLHLGMRHSLFGIMHGGELRFLKPMQLTGERLMGTLEKALARFDQAEEEIEVDTLLQNLQEEEETDDGRVVVDAAAVASVQQKAVGHATEVLHALRLQAEALAQEVRACLRHFANRHRGARLAELKLAGFGAALPEVATALENALALPITVAQPFTSLGITAPEEVLADQHQWCVPLGLALRSLS